MTAIVSSLLGAVVAYLVLTVPNDLKADALLKHARKDLSAGDGVKARESLSRIVQQFPRTDAAAAATVALAMIGDQDRQKLQGELDRLRHDHDTVRNQVSELTKSVEAIGNAPPRTVTVEAPPRTITIYAPPPKKAPAKGSTPAKKTRHRRR